MIQKKITFILKWWKILWQRFCWMQNTDVIFQRGQSCCAVPVLWKRGTSLKTGIFWNLKLRTDSMRWTKEDHREVLETKEKAVRQRKPHSFSFIKNILVTFVSAIGNSHIITFAWMCIFYLLLKIISVKKSINLYCTIVF